MRVVLRYDLGGMVGTTPIIRSVEEMRAEVAALRDINGARIVLVTQVPKGYEPMKALFTSEKETVTL